MARRGVTIKGRAALQRKLDRLPQVAKDRIKATMAAEADRIVAFMKRHAPVLKESDPRRRAGTLRDSIGWTWGRPPQGSGIVAVVKSKIGDDLTVTFYAGGGEAFYARFVEFGTQKMSAQPFFYVSWRANRREARREIRKAVRQAAREVAKG